MLVLALDTTTRGGSHALARDGHVLCEEAGDASRPQAERLPGDLMTLLERGGVRLDEIDVYAVAIGPGSFTGLRVGIATMQGLAFAGGKPLVGVSALDALHHAAQPFTGRVATWMDAWRGEVYAALYEDDREVDAPCVAAPQQLLARLGGRPTIFIGDAAATYAGTIRAALPDAVLADPVTPLLAGTIARLATSAARAGHRPPPHAIRPLYVRRVDPPSATRAGGAAAPRRAV